MRDLGVGLVNALANWETPLRSPRRYADPLVWAPHPSRTVGYVTPSYARTALQVPLPVVPSGYSDWEADPASPTQYLGFTAGDTSGVSLKLNRNSRRSETAYRLGVAGYCILQGLTLTDGDSLRVVVADGVAAINGPVNPAGTSASLTDEAVNYLWMLSNGAFSVVVNSIDAPSTACVYLGAITTTLGIISVIDYSGRMELRKESLWRKTADAAVPTDTPNADIRFLHETKAGLWFWDGSQYLSVDAATYLSLSVAGSSNVALTQAQARVTVLKFTGVLTGNINVTTPNAIPGQSWTIINGTSGAFTLTFKTASGTGIAVTQGKVALLCGDGTNIISAFTDSTAMGLGTAATQAQIAADPNDALPDATTVYTQANFDTVKAEINDLKNKMRTSGILAT